MNLILHLKRQYFDEIKSGAKTEEYRLVTAYWAKRLENRNYDRVILFCGYPKRGDADRMISFPWRGYQKKVILHPFFSGGKLPTKVYAIKLEK